MAEEIRTYPEKFALRLPKGMLARLDTAAKENNRSKNQEIVARLEASFRDAPSLDGPIDLVAVVQETLDDHEKRLAKLEARSELEDAPSESTLELQTMQLRNMLKKEE